MATVTLKGNVCNLCGTDVNVGDNAPEITVVNSAGLADKVVGGSKDKAQLIVVVPSLDTPVCAAETRKFNEKAASIAGVDTTVISMDLPFAAGKFCSAEGIENLTVASDFRNKDFAKAYGVLIADGALAGITCRAIFVVDTCGKVVYKELVPEITAEPDYDAALNAAAAAAPKSTCCGGGHCS
ncbi:thiol peroxidase [Arcobacter sp. FWKO B]|uniref:thiol peroxidase n=1 Tax=Arcobacter sp. FWKO B TaxID=2593672 RepID=UPI0018A6131E|nr:thiol peroxidase [Arcobacter sp. FWKO B]QOG12928.1 thiol peroxidase [Arcobacter sp. FWKO B]